MLRILIILTLLPVVLAAQPVQYHFNHLTKSEGMSNSVVRTIAQDKYGFIWLGTLHGLNRYNGYQITRFFHEPGKSGSLINHSISILFCDRNGTMWVGSRPGLSYFDYATQTFTLVSGSDSLTVLDMRHADARKLWLLTNRGIRMLDLAKKEITGPPVQSLTDVRAGTIFVAGDGRVYFGSNSGLHIYDPSSRSLKQVKNPLAPESDSAVNVRAILIDKKGNCWISISNPDYRIYRLDMNLQAVKEYPPVPPLYKGKSETLLRKIHEDRFGNIWVSSSQRGLLKYVPENDEFIFFRNDVYLPNSLASDNINCIFEDREGGLWLGTEGYGADRFYPAKNFFKSIQVSAQQKISILHNWCRAACQDSTGNIWLGSGLGLTRYLRGQDTVIHYRNISGEQKVIHSSSIRSLATDRKGTVWIGTSDGLNSYNPVTGRFEFWDEKQGLPTIFVWTLLIDNKGVLWAGGNSGIYRFDAVKRRFDNFETDSVLSPIRRQTFRKIWQDTKGRYWLAANDLFLYEPGQNRIRKITPTNSKSNAPLAELVTDFAEEKNGRIWMSVNGTSNNGLICYDPENGTFVSYNMNQGLPSNETSGLLFDKKDRLWIATGNGLCYLDSSRKNFVSFDKNDGLPSNQFNEQSACVTREGNFIYPTYHGFTLFDPEIISREKENPDIHISSFKVLNKECTNGSSPEDLKEISLGYDQNFFSIELTSPYYVNSGKCWYAYKLDGFEKEWHYTQDRLANYTNVPGGDYTFLYKSTVNPGSWEVAEKKLSIHVDTKFTQTTWFRLLILLAIIGVIYSFYRYRLMQQEKIHLLKARAGSLEKEKAMAMYENLKQHLNPHFLFNSLTSLSGLIEIDPKRAAGFLGQMSQIYRYILKNKDSELVHLGDEVKFADLYIQLLKTRFNSGMYITIHIPDEYNYRKIVPVTLQNLIENAIKHNVIDPEECLCIDVYVEDDYLIVKNNLQKKKMVETSNKQGLNNLKSFYSYLSNRPVLIEETATHFIVKIPLI